MPASWSAGGPRDDRAGNDPRPNRSARTRRLARGLLRLGTAAAKGVGAALTTGLALVGATQGNSATIPCLLVIMVAAGAIGYGCETRQRSAPLSAAQRSEVANGIILAAVAALAVTGADDSPARRAQRWSQHSPRWPRWCARAVGLSLRLSPHWSLRRNRPQRYRYRRPLRPRSSHQRTQPRGSSRRDRAPGTSSGSRPGPRMEAQLPAAGDGSGRSGPSRPRLPAAAGVPRRVGTPGPRRFSTVDRLRSSGGRRSLALPDR